MKTLGEVFEGVKNQEMKVVQDRASLSMSQMEEKEAGLDDGEEQDSDVSPLTATLAGSSYHHHTRPLIFIAILLLWLLL
jgi:hypothetical protein